MGIEERMMGAPHTHKYNCGSTDCPRPDRSIEDNDRSNDIVRDTVKYENMDFVFIESFYDIALSGLCNVNNELHAFDIIDEEGNEYFIYPLTRIEKIKRKIGQWLFEWCVGYHWSYPHRKNGNRFGQRRPRWFWSILFKVYHWAN